MTERQPDSAFTPISPNPFIVGNPVRDRAMFFGREAEFELVRRRFQDSSHGGLLVFCGERRSGKTSILFQILDRRLGPDFIPVLIDMQSMAVGNEAEFLTRLSADVLQALGPDGERLGAPRFVEDSSHSATFQKFVQEVLRIHPEKKLILLFDEYELFENKIDSGLLAEDVLHVLSNLIENWPVFLIFTGSQHLEQRRREYWKILGRSIYKQITFLERADALSLVQKPVEGRVRYAEGVVEAIYRLTSGHPFYTQAICQSLVDHMNDRRTNRATAEALAGVVDGIVNNPLPQMIFLWDSLERDEKLVLALLAEALPDEQSHAAVARMSRLLRRRQYPIELDPARIATALEKLFKSEMLLRSDRTSPPEYAFRMDLWRLWIRRMHSVWQVMREEGLEIRRLARRLSTGWRIAIGGTLTAGALVAGISIPPRLAARRPGSDRGAAPPPGAIATFALETDPAGAAIYLDDRQVGTGVFRGPIGADRDQRFHLTAAGCADTTLVVRIPAGESGTRHVALRSLLGDLQVGTQPPGAEILVDGRAAGRSPVTVRGLPAAKPHRVEATLAGFEPARIDANVRPDEVAPLTLVLETRKLDVLVTTDPSGGRILLDGVARGTSPAQLRGLAVGRHTLAASLDGYEPAETTTVVGPETHQIQMRLAPEPLGSLVVQGDLPAQFFVDGKFVVENLQNSGPQPLARGLHQIHVVLSTSAVVDTSVVVKPRERVTFDYSRRTVSRRPMGAR